MQWDRMKKNQSDLLKKKQKTSKWKKENAIVQSGNYGATKWKSSFCFGEENLSFIVRNSTVCCLQTIKNFKFYSNSKEYCFILFFEKVFWRHIIENSIVDG